MTYAGVMSAYVRPVVPDQVFYDADGRVVDYGERWGGESPPAESYSIDPHPERFAPLHDVARALIDHLVEAYDVTAVDDLSHAGDLWYPRDDVVRAIRLSPNAPDAAGLTVVFAGYPLVVVRAGLLSEWTYPDCGCGACDETWQGQADEMEWQIFAVLAGSLVETVEGVLGRRGLRLEASSTVTAIDGSQSQGATFPSRPATKSRMAAARRTLAAIPGGWAPWPTRQAQPPAD